MLFNDTKSDIIVLLEGARGLFGSPTNQRVVFNEYISKDLSSPSNGLLANIINIYALNILY